MPPSSRFPRIIPCENSAITWPRSSLTGSDVSLFGNRLRHGALKLIGRGAAGTLRDAGSIPAASIERPGASPSGSGRGLLPAHSAAALPPPLRRATPRLKASSLSQPERRQFMRFSRVFDLTLGHLGTPVSDTGSQALGFELAARRFSRSASAVRGAAGWRSERRPVRRRYALRGFSAWLDTTVSPRRSVCPGRAWVAARSSRCE